jgi:hypothetical protein
MSTNTSPTQAQANKITLGSAADMLPDHTWKDAPLCVLDGAEIVPAGRIEFIADRYGRRAIVLKPRHLTQAIAEAQ